MESLFEEMGGTYRQEGDYLIPNLALPEEPEYRIGEYGRMRRSYSERVSPCSLREPAHKRNAASTPCRNRPSLQQAYGNHRFCNGEAGKCDRNTQSY